ncbi:unnamed protein product [Arabidopsis arenosa]|uniref:Uncharacterized protein n=1 Tax=Arabidopsis arenosa TaxID=38785 RepID=A0A8S1ZQM2_ARAAE|nr:unnamed protein product [Arabidopsis arenosa]
MSSISQSILMALTVTVNKYASSNVQAVRRNDTKRDSLTAPVADLGRRNILFSSTSFIATALTSSDQLLQKYLKKTEENKAKNDKERLDSFYKRNYKDYFEFVEGSIKGKTEAELILICCEFDFSINHELKLVDKMKELKRRGMTPTSLLQDYEGDQDEIKTGKETGNSSKATATTPAFDKSLFNQRERSLALNSEGLEEFVNCRNELLTVVSGIDSAC